MTQTTKIEGGVLLLFFTISRNLGVDSSELEQWYHDIINLLGFLLYLWTLLPTARAFLLMVISWFQDGCSTSRNTSIVQTDEGGTRKKRPPISGEQNLLINHLNISFCLIGQNSAKWPLTVSQAKTCRVFFVCLFLYLST